MVVAGIDPGLSGGVAVVSPDYGCTSILMPVADGIIDSFAVGQFLTDHCVEFVVIEKTHSMPKQGVKSTFTFGFVSGQVRGAAEALGFPCKTVRPQEWKKHFDLINKDKNASRACATALFPRSCHQFLRVKDHGRAEAALIAAMHLGLTA
jgi:hypothetical protein